MAAIEVKKPVNYLIVDSSVLIRRAPLKDLAEKVYSVAAVVSEIKDEQTRASLQILPYDFNFKEPTSDSIKFVRDFAKKTGDFQNISVVDLHLIALTYQLCKENMSPEEFAQLKSEPPKDNQPLINAHNVKLDKPVNIMGFYLPKKSTTVQVDNIVEVEAELADEFKKSVCIEAPDTDLNNNTSLNEDGSTEDVDDGFGWITPSNLEEVKKQSKLTGEEKEIDDGQIRVGCMTSDFSMQNVLIQIGIAVLSVDGLLIKKPRSYVLKCVTCSKITTNMAKQFCPWCGYKSMERVVVTVDEDGNKVYRGRRKIPSAKRLIHSLPMPKGGKHDNYPILSEDQPRAQQLPSRKAMVKNDPLDPDYATYNSPFTTRDVYSRAALLGIRADNNSRFNKRV